MSMRASSTSPRCPAFACHRGGDHAHGHAVAQRCGRPLGRAACFVGGGIAAAFFASLERCSCVDVRTNDDDPDAGETAPLMPGRDATAAARKKSRRSTAAAAASAGKGKIGRGGFGCCDDTTTAAN